MPVEHPRQQQVGQAKLRAPGVGCGAGHDDVVPHVAVAGEVGGLVEERVVQQRQVRGGHCGPDGLQVGVVDGKALGQRQHGPGHRRLVGALLYVAHRPFHVLAGEHQQALEPAGVDGAEVGHVAGVGFVQPGGHIGGAYRHRLGPRAGDEQVHVDALAVHVCDAALGVVVADPVGGGVLGDHQAPDLALQRGPAARSQLLLQVRLLADLAQVAPWLDAEVGPGLLGIAVRERQFHPALVVGQLCVPAVEQFLIGVAPEHLHRRPHMGVGVDDGQTVAHDVPPGCCCAPAAVAPGRPTAADCIPFARTRLHRAGCHRSA